MARCGPNVQISKVDLVFISKTEKVLLWDLKWKGKTQKVYRVLKPNMNDLIQKSLRNNARKMYITYQWLSIHVSEMKEKFVSRAGSEPATPRILVGRDIFYFRDVCRKPLVSYLLLSFISPQAFLVNNFFNSHENMTIGVRARCKMTAKVSGKMREEIFAFFPSRTTCASRSPRYRLCSSKIRQKKLRLFCRLFGCRPFKRIGLQQTLNRIPSFQFYHVE